jgi:hypothetical protein
LQRDRLLLPVVAIDRHAVPRTAWPRLRALLYRSGIELDGPHIHRHGLTHPAQLRKTLGFPIPLARLLESQDFGQSGLMFLARRLDRQGALEFFGGLIELAILQQLPTSLIMRRSCTLSGYRVLVLQ